MERLRAHWMTTLTMLTAGFLAMVGVAFLAGAGEGDRAGFVGWGVVCLIGAGAMVIGMWGLWSGGIGGRGANALVVVGLVVAGLFWWMFIPAAVALVLLYCGVVRGGLRRELARSPSRNSSTPE